MSSNKLSMRVVFLCLVIRLMSVTANGLDLEQCDTPEQCLLWSASSNSQLQRKDTQPCVSKPAPFWQGSAVVDGKIEDIKLTDYRGKYLVFFFYPLDFTFVCPTEVLAFNDNIDAFRKIGTEVLGVSVDSHFSHLAWINSLKRDGRLVDMRIPLLSDLTHQISQSYGVYLHDKGHSLRGLFIIDREGILRQITLNDLEVGRSVEETLRLVQAFQHHDASGELCPSGWKPGDPAIEIPKSEKENINSESVDTMAV